MLIYASGEYRRMLGVFQAQETATLERQRRNWNGGIGNCIPAAFLARLQRVSLIHFYDYDFIFGEIGFFFVSSEAAA